MLIPHCFIPFLLTFYFTFTITVPFIFEKAMLHSTSNLSFINLLIHFPLSFPSISIPPPGISVYKYIFFLSSFSLSETYFFTSQQLKPSLLIDPALELSPFLPKLLTLLPLLSYSPCYLPCLSFLCPLYHFPIIF